MAYRGLYKPENEEFYKLSRSKVESHIKCPRCFYLDRRLGVSQPPGFPFNLNSAVDHLLKTEFDIYREESKPHPYIKKLGLNAVPYRNKELDNWRNNQIKIAIEALYNGTKYGVIANMNDEIVVQRDVLKYIQFNYPSFLIDLDQRDLSENEKIAIFTKTVQSDKTLKSLLSSKLRFMGSKLKYLNNYKNSLQKLQSLMSEEY